MIVSAGNTAAIRGAYGQRATTVLATRPIAPLCGFIYDLIECWEYIITKLNFGNWNRAVGGKAIGEANNPLLSQRRIKTPRFAKFLLQIARSAEYTTEMAYVPPNTMTRWSSSIAVINALLIACKRFILTTIQSP